MKKVLLFLLFLSIVPALFGIFHPGFFTTDDGGWMVIRLSAFYEALRQGQFPVRFLPRLNNGFGYPVADFLYPLFLYIGSLIHLFHIPFVMTIKLLFGLSLISAAVGCFLWLRRKFNNLAGFVGAVVYTLFPYHLWDITKRGSLGEVLAMGIIPFIFWGVDIENIPFLSLCIGLLILSHNTLALLFLPIVFCYIVLMGKLRKLFISFFLGLGFSAFFWIPALFDLKYTVFSKTIVSEYSKYFLFSDLYPLIGLITFVVIFLSAFFIFKKPKTLPAFFLILALISISLTSQVSFLLWNVFRLGTYVQFPFRFLSLTTLAVGFLAAYVTSEWPEKKKLIAVLVILVLYFSSWKFFIAKNYQFYPDTFYSTNQDTTTVQNEYIPYLSHRLN